MDVDSEGKWHIVYSDGIIHEDGNCTPTQNIKYKNSTSGPVTIARGYSPSIAVGPDDTLHVIYHPGGSIIYRSKSMSGDWSTPQTIETLGPDDLLALIELSIDIDSKGEWHVVYTDHISSDDYNYLKYRNSNFGPVILATVDRGDYLNSPSIAINPTKLFTLIPGINDHGVMMLWRAEEMFRYDAETEIQICESPDSRMCIRPDSIKCLNNPSNSQVRQAILEASKKAVEKGKDVIVNIDMDLENYSIVWEYFLPPFLNRRWNRSVTWAGRIANIVSEAFNEEIPKGRRMLYAHSAGGDAAYQSIYQMRGKKMYDDFNLLNGRTSAKKLAKALKDSGYGWWQVKVFTNEGDLLATPPLPLLKLWLGSISNYDVAKSYAGDAWVHLHSFDITGHSGLRDAINVPGTFEINLVRSSGPPNCTVVDTVENLMLKDWRKP